MNILSDFLIAPSILAADGKKLSKRKGASSVMQYQVEGYLPDAVLNYLIRLGWSHGDDEIFTRADILKLFDIDHVQKSPSALNPDKLLWLNQHYLKEMPVADLAEQLVDFYTASGVVAEDKDFLQQVIPIFIERSKTLVDFVAQTRFFFVNTVEFVAAATEKFFNPAIVEPLQYFHDQLNALADWNKEAIYDVIQATLEKFELKMGKFAPVVRVAVTGDKVSPSLDVTLLLLGKEKTIQRLACALHSISSS